MNDIFKKFSLKVDAVTPTTGRGCQLSYLYHIQANRAVIKDQTPNSLSKSPDVRATDTIMI